MNEEMTPTEEKIMHIIWRLERAFVKDIIAEMDDPKPPYNTVSSVVRLLEQKGYVGHTAYGRSHQYFPEVSKKDYSKRSFRSLLGNYFGGSYESLMSFIVQEEKLSKKEIKELEALITATSKEKKNK